MAYFPFFIDVKERVALIVGGGSVAFAKVKKLLEFGIKLRVVATDILPEICALREVELTRRGFDERDLDDAPAFVVAATDDAALNTRIAESCRARGIMVNVVDSPEESSFIFPATVRRGPLVAAVSTSGTSPCAAAHFKSALAGLLPDNIDEILDSLANVREEYKTKIDDPTTRKRFFKTLWEETIEAARPLTDSEVAETYRRVAREERDAEKQVGYVALVGAGAGPCDLITLRGMNLLKKADVVLYDELIDRKLLGFASTHAELLPVGKRCGDRSSRQSDINDLLIARAKEGKFVVRLKGGDPLLFGRGGEEAMALKDADVPFEVVPGITSALYIPMEAGIPVTHRGLSRSVHIVAAHTSDGKLGEDISKLAELDGTIVFLMGLNSLETIAETLIEKGKDPKTPAAVISGGNSDKRYVIRGRLENIVRKAKEGNATAPATIVIGDVAAMDLLAK